MLTNPAGSQLSLSCAAAPFAVCELFNGLRCLFHRTFERRWAGAAAPAFLEPYISRQLTNAVPYIGTAAADSRA